LKATIFRINVVLSLFFIFQPGRVCGAAQQIPTPQKLQVVILPISEFADHRWDNAALQTSIEKSANDLEDFFSKKFPDAIVHVLKPAQTDSQSIRDFLRGDFAKFADGTVTLFFVLSHGVPNPSPNTNYNQDLLIVTRDTDHDHPENRAFSVATDLVPEFTKLKSPGSIVLAFLDTCYSGAASNLSMHISTSLAEDYGLRLMVMASSLSEAQSYKATFSEALIELWKRPSNNACTTPDLAPTELRQSISRQLSPQKLGPIEGLPKVVIPYYGKLCLESFAADGGLIVFYNARSDTVAAIIKQNGQPIDDSIPLEFNNVIPYKISRRNYALSIVRGDGVQILEDNVDLNADPVSFETIGTPKLAQLGAVYMRTAEYAKRVWLPAQQADYQKRAYASFLATNEDKAASAAAADLVHIGPQSGKEWQLAYALSNEHVVGLGPGDTPAESQARQEVGLDGLAKVEKLSGRFSKAAVLYLKIAESAPADGSSKYAKQAYFAAGAAGDLNLARGTRQKFGLDIASECSLCIQKEEAAWAEREHPTKTKDDFKALCMLESLRHLDY
jgi:hypothetical protein